MDTIISGLIADSNSVILKHADKKYAEFEERYPVSSRRHAYHNGLIDGFLLATREAIERNFHQLTDDSFQKLTTPSDN